MPAHLLGHPFEHVLPRRHKIAMLYVQSYFDESRTIGKDKLISFCCFLGTNEDWQVCFNRCHAVFDNLGVDILKASHVFKYKTPLSSRNPALGVATRVEVLSELIKAIRGCLPVSVMAALDYSAFKDLSQSDRNLFHDDPTYLTFLQAIIAVEHVLGQRFSDPDCHVSIVCDDNQKYAAEYLEAFHRVRQLHPEFKKTFVSIGFADDKCFRQLQMADFLAGVVRREADHLFYNTPFDLRELYLRFSDATA